MPSGTYHQLFQVEKSFRMAKSDLQARHHAVDVAHDAVGGCGLDVGPAVQQRSLSV
jgi:hypothetical protein